MPRAQDPINTILKPVGRGVATGLIISRCAYCIELIIIHSAHTKPDSKSKEIRSNIARSVYRTLELLFIFFASVSKARALPCTTGLFTRLGSQ